MTEQQKCNNDSAEMQIGKCHYEIMSQMGIYGKRKGTIGMSAPRFAGPTNITWGAGGIVFFHLKQLLWFEP